jgi:hypothetical protein
VWTTTPVALTTRRSEGALDDASSTRTASTSAPLARKALVAQQLVHRREVT